MLSDITKTPHIGNKEDISEKDKHDLVLKPGTFLENDVSQAWRMKLSSSLTSGPILVQTARGTSLDSQH